MRRAPDPELIALARKGSPEAAAVLFDRYWPTGIIEGERRALMGWVALGAILPLGFVLLRRNL